MKRIGLFGGSFDPVHLGHLRIALDAKRQLALDEVWFLPALAAPLKEELPVAFAHRCEMVKRMISPYRKLRLCPIEETLPQPNFTINTVTALQERYPGVAFFWIMGSDQADQFGLWREKDKLKTLITFCVYPRNSGDTIPEGMIALKFRDYLHYSSTEIRQGKVGLTKPDVVRYMMENGLYVDEIARFMVGPKRWKHVSSMRDLAVRIASAHGIDTQKTNLAALFHDCMKNRSDTELKNILRIYEPSYLTKDPAFWHQRAGMYIARNRFHIRNRSVLAAIGNHVEGKHPDPIAKIIYLADKLDASRGYDSTRQIEMALHDLDAALRYVKKEQQEHLKREGIDV
ncbi:MAG: nicotinate (nicotinamide) nucleotide adenylyltransferase [Erysipelotrichaceae bacterium]